MRAYGHGCGDVCPRLPFLDVLEQAETMLTIWIIHRDAQHRATLARIAGAGDSTVLGAPTDRLFESASPPGAVVLGLSGDFEQELDFVHRFGSRLRRSAWILLAPVGDLDEVRRLFDTLRARLIAYPPSPLELRRALRAALQRRTADSLSSRKGRDTLRDRFARWFADLELPELMRAIDPRLSQLPLLIRGEEGTGRALLARYVHAFGGSGEEAFIPVNCREITRAEDLLRQIDGSAAANHNEAWTIWLEDVDCLPLPLQRLVRDWIEFGLPDGTLRASELRWIAGAGDDGDLDADPGLDPRLTQALSGLTVRIPPLRERRERIEAFTADTALAWCSTYGERLRRFSRDAVQLLNDYPWPGNFRELEAVVIRTLSFSSSDPLLPVHLRFPGDSCWLGQREDDSALTETEAEIPEATILEEDEEAYVEEESEEVYDEEEIEEAIGPLLTPIRRGGLSPDEESSDAVEMAVRAAESVLPIPPTAAAGQQPDSRLRRLVRAVAHEVRNPLVSIRTFSELLPDHYDDAEFRTHFRELVGQDVRRIDEAVGRLQNIVDMPEVKSQPVHMAHLLEGLLDERQGEIQSRRLLVLKELDHDVPYALGDPLQLRDAFAGLLDRALAGVSDRGDIYLASKHHESGLAGRPSVRVLLRHTTAAVDDSGSRGTQPRADLDLVLAETVIQALDGSLTVDTTDSQERVIVVDLPAPS